MNRKDARETVGGLCALLDAEPDIAVARPALDGEEPPSRLSAVVADANPLFAH